MFGLKYATNAVLTWECGNPRGHSKIRVASSHHRFANNTFDSTFRWQNKSVDCVVATERNVRLAISHMTAIFNIVAEFCRSLPRHIPPPRLTSLISHSHKPLDASFSSSTFDSINYITRKIKSSYSIQFTPPTEFMQNNFCVSDALFVFFSDHMKFITIIKLTAVKPEKAKKKKQHGISTKWLMCINSRLRERSRWI